MAGFNGSGKVIKLPRFELDCRADMKRTLTSLGMGIAFDKEKADFREMCSAHVWIEKALQKTFVKVDEDGTEASAATSVKFRASAVDLYDGTVVIDRPFFFAIRDDKTGEILFLGSVVDPR